MVIDDTGSVEDIHAFIYCKKWRSGQVSPMPDRLTDSHMKDSATQLLIKFKTGALVTQQEQEVLADLKCNYCMIYIVFPAPCCPHFKGHLWLWNISDGDEMA